MGVMNFLRERLGKIVAITIGASLLAFIVTEVITSGKSFFNSGNDVGEVSGEKITLTDFNKSVEQNTEQIKRQYGQMALNPQFTGMIQNQAWDGLVGRIILQKQIDKLGITVGGDEVQDMVSGPNPNQQIIQNFTNQQTGQFDRNELLGFLQKMKVAKDNDPMKATWTSFINQQLIEGKKTEKYLALVKNGLFINSLDALDDYDSKSRLAKFKYVDAEYSSIPDDKVSLTDDDYKSYYDEHKNEFKNQQETRSFDFVTFNGSPSKQDSADVEAAMAKLVPEFKAAANDSLFVTLNAETKTNASPAYQKKGQLNPKLDTVMFNSPIGTVYGPYFLNGSYNIAKLMESRTSPDSVSARHILINPSAVGGLENAQKLADSLKKLIVGGKKTFADLAQANSSDKGSAVKGGDLGTFARGSMVPVFEDAVFNGKKGDIKIVTSQYGVHLIEILNQKGASKVVKVAVVDRPLSASQKTQTSAYTKAQTFLASLNKGNFDDEAKKEGLVKKTAADVTGTATTAGGLDNAHDLVRWAFNNANKGDFTDKVFQSGDLYVVATLTTVKPKGILSVDDVKAQIKPQVMARVKAKMLNSKFEDALKGAGNIDQFAQKVGGKVVPVENIVFANPVLPGTGQENKLVGAVFGSQPNKLSKIIEGEKGIFVFNVDGFTNSSAANNLLRQKEQLGQALGQRVEGGILEGLKDKANIKDYRARIL